MWNALCTYRLRSPPKSDIGPHSEKGLTLSISASIRVITIAMALVLAGAASLQPEARLDQALAEYEAILSDEDKIQFHNQGVPDSMAAIRFTILIDSKCNDRRRQCMGPRLITFLESIQHFSGVVDTFVSSKPQVAALLWGGVKMALLVISEPGYIKPPLTVPGCE